MGVVDVGDAVAVAVFAHGGPCGVNELADAFGCCGGFCVGLPAGFLLDLCGDEWGCDFWAEASGALDVLDVGGGDGAGVEGGGVGGGACVVEEEEE